MKTHCPNLVNTALTWCRPIPDQNRKCNFDVYQNIYLKKNEIQKNVLLFAFLFFLHNYKSDVSFSLEFGK